MNDQVKRKTIAITITNDNEKAIFISWRESQFQSNHAQTTLKHAPLGTMPAPGATSLTALIASMNPILHSGNYVFATVPPSDTTFQDRLRSHSFEMLFRESEGWTLIADQATVDALGLEAIFPCKKVTLGVHSSLDAVGFMAAITTRLAEAGLGINPVSGFYHDHL